MPDPLAHYNKQEHAKLGTKAYDRYVLPHVKDEDVGKFAAVDIESGAYEIDESELAASARLLARNSNAQIWLVRIGSRYVRRFGPLRQPTAG